jgi:DedD protein
MADSEDVSTLKRRGRRRLVGAIALVLVAVIVLPMIFDSEPRQAPSPVSVRIPSEDDTGFTPKVTPKVAAAPDKADAKPEPKPEPKAAPAPEPKPEPKQEPEPKPEPKPVPKPAAKKEPKAPEATPAAPVPAVAAPAGQFMIPVGAYVDPSGVIAQLKQGKVPYFTEPIATAKGTVIRVRAGPFASQAAADKALAQIQGLGLKPGKVTARP